MFGKKDASASFSTGSTTLVSKNTEIVGDIRFSGNLMVEGTVKGNIYTSGATEAHARVLEDGVIEGDIRVPTLVINGTIDGDVYSDKHIELAAKAVVNGNVHYSLIEIVKGAQVNGNLVYCDVSEIVEKTSSSGSPSSEPTNNSAAIIDEAAKLT